MKWITTILSIYIFALAVLPCADEAIWCIFDLEEAVGVELHETGDHNHENGCSDHCSPFCTCSCCQMTIRMPIKDAMAISSPVQVFADIPSYGAILIDLTYINSIWQPPQLS